MDIRLITRKATIQTLLTLVTWTVLALSLCQTQIQTGLMSWNALLDLTSVVISYYE